MRHTHAYRAGAALLLMLCAAGCAGRGDDKAATAADPAAPAVERARAYMTAVLARDWTTACAMMTADRRAFCHSIHATTEPPEPGGPVIGAVTLDRAPTRAPALTAHPEGWAVMVSHTVTWPERSTTTSRTALRMVETGRTWEVEQREDVFDSDLVHAPDPAVAALSRRGSR
ncbi:MULTISPECIES: hypothetical protein [unclassified Streptomyces]|uniref:hypothetical protein n=1 Tax=unclassified Streptomyces TaxID=2593676 RepID=UPI003649CFC6